VAQIVNLDHGRVPEPRQHGCLVNEPLAYRGTNARVIVADAQDLGAGGAAQSFIFQPIDPAVAAVGQLIDHPIT